MVSVDILEVHCFDVRASEVFPELYTRLQERFLVTGGMMTADGTLKFVLRDETQRVRSAAERAVREYCQNRHHVELVDAPTKD
jgi:hypothetical protein